MRLSFMTWVCPDWDLDRILDFADRTPYDGVELRVDVDHEHGVSAEDASDRRREVRERFADRGVDLPAVATGEEFAHSDPEEWRSNVERAKENVELAGDLGADVVRIFAGGDREEMTEDAAADAAEAFTEVGEFAEEHGVRPLLETMHDIVQSPEDALAVKERVETENFGLLWNRASIDPSAFERLRGEIDHVHMHEEVLDPEFTDVESMMERFGDDGYDGYFSLEIIRGEDLPEDQLIETGERLSGYLDAAR